jgi:hypothetical protein
MFHEYRYINTVEGITHYYLKKAYSKDEIRGMIKFLAGSKEIEVFVCKNLARFIFNEGII